MKNVFRILALIRPRIIALVLFTMTAAACTVGRQAPPWPLLVHALLGTAAIIAGALALNQRFELRGDARMARTAGRPLPSGRLTRGQVTRFGIAASVAGLAYLALTTANVALVALVAASWVIYLCTYTPLKSRTAWQTPIGAVAGAMPTLLGAATAETGFGTMALAMFGIVYFWQFPHAMAIAWLYRHQFAAAEVKLATVVDPSGRLAGRLAFWGAVALLPVSLIPVATGLADGRYGLIAVLLGAGYLALATGFLRRADDVTARRLLRGSLVYLPALLAALLWSAGILPA